MGVEVFYGGLLAADRMKRPCGFTESGVIYLWGDHPKVSQVSHSNCGLYDGVGPIVPRSSQGDAAPRLYFCQLIEKRTPHFVVKITEQRSPSSPTSAAGMKPRVLSGD